MGIIIDLLFPRRCLHCHAYIRNGVLCHACRTRITLYDTFFCGACGARMGRARRVCHTTFPYLLGAASDYRNPIIQDVIRKLKFSLVSEAGTFLGELLGTYATPLLFPRKNTYVVPIPLSPQRERERGFNQSELIARAFALHLGLHLECKALSRIAHTKPQSTLENLSLRERNVAGCFSLREGAALHGKTVLLVDDVVTSGATLREAARTLKEGGVRKVYAFVVAKA